MSSSSIISSLKSCTAGLEHQKSTVKCHDPVVEDVITVPFSTSKKDPSQTTSIVGSKVFVRGSMAQLSNDGISTSFRMVFQEGVLHSLEL